MREHYSQDARINIGNQFIPATHSFVSAPAPRITPAPRCPQCPIDVRKDLARNVSVCAKHKTMMDLHVRDSNCNCCQHGLGTAYSMTRCRACCLASVRPCSLAFQTQIVLSGKIAKSIAEEAKYLIEPLWAVRQVCTLLTPSCSVLDKRDGVMTRRDESIPPAPFDYVGDGIQRATRVVLRQDSELLRLQLARFGVRECAGAPGPPIRLGHVQTV